MGCAEAILSDLNERKVAKLVDTWAGIDVFNAYCVFLCFTNGPWKIQTKNNQIPTLFSVLFAGLSRMFQIELISTQSNHKSMRRPSSEVDYAARHERHGTWIPSSLGRNLSQNGSNHLDKYPPLG